MTAPTRFPCSYPECGGGCSGCQPEPQQTPRPSWVDGGATLHRTEGAEERFERAIQWLRDNYQDHNIATLCDGLLAAYGASAPSDWRPVPTTPTEEMLKAGRKAIHHSHNALKKAAMVYEAMLAAAPPAPNQGEAS